MIDVINELCSTVVKGVPISLELVHHVRRISLANYVIITW